MVLCAHKPTGKGKLLGVKVNSNLASKLSEGKAPR